jgi:hypothetical protein
MLVSLEIEKNSDDFNIDKSKSLNKHQTRSINGFSYEAGPEVSDAFLLLKKDSFDIFQKVIKDFFLIGYSYLSTLMNDRSIFY